MARRIMLDIIDAITLLAFLAATLFIGGFVL
jgi:hypothetical protein